ncbi:hypothetical protein V499_08785 [Pseudogymnoascus sp. VKM F-103]|nr:hypothetical protein V499_08785 [Pseudogymnoascus sp. VKM F-103]
MANLNVAQTGIFPANLGDGAVVSKPHHPIFKDEIAGNTVRIRSASTHCEYEAYAQQQGGFTWRLRNCVWFVVQDLGVPSAAYNDRHGA